MGLDWLLNPLLVTIFGPLLGAVVILFLPSRAGGAIKGVALVSAGAALAAPRRQDRATGARAHAVPEPVHPRASTVVGLVGALALGHA